MSLLLRGGTFALPIGMEIQVRLSCAGHLIPFIILFSFVRVLDPGSLSPLHIIIHSLCRFSPSWHVETWWSCYGSRRHRYGPLCTNIMVPLCRPCWRWPPWGLWCWWWLPWDAPRVRLPPLPPLHPTSANNNNIPTNVASNKNNDRDAKGVYAILHSSSIR